MFQILTISMAFVVILIGVILFFMQPPNFSLFWTTAAGLIIASSGFVYNYIYKIRRR